MGVVQRSVAGLVACALGFICPELRAEAEPEIANDAAELRQVSFGVGAAWLRALRISDRASDDRLLSEFFAAWAPWGGPVAIGAELAIGDQARFLVRPHLRLTAIREAPVSLCLDGGPAWLTGPQGAAWGGGAGVSLGVDLMDHLAVELRAACLLINLPPGTAAGLVAAAADPLPEQGAGWVVLPSVGLRVRAAF